MKFSNQAGAVLKAMKFFKVAGIVMSAVSIGEYCSYFMTQISITRCQNHNHRYLRAHHKTSLVLEAKVSGLIVFYLVFIISSFFLSSDRSV